LPLWRRTKGQILSHSEAARLSEPQRSSLTGHRATTKNVPSLTSMLT
jgi:hypothetical protein